MNESTKNLLLFLGGAAVGSLAVLALSKNTTTMRPALADLASGALDLRDKAMGALQRTKEDVSDFMAEVDYARAVKAEQQNDETEEPVEIVKRKTKKTKQQTENA
jgi:hypothetical protein